MLFSNFLHILLYKIIFTDEFLIRNCTLSVNSKVLNIFHNIFFILPLKCWRVWYFLLNIALRILVCYNSILIAHWFIFVSLIIILTYCSFHRIKILTNNVLIIHSIRLSIICEVWLLFYMCVIQNLVTLLTINVILT